MLTVKEFFNSAISDDLKKARAAAIPSAQTVKRISYFFDLASERDMLLITEPEKIPRKTPVKQPYNTIIKVKSYRVIYSEKTLEKLLNMADKHGRHEIIFYNDNLIFE